jgi:hypothetical protein
VLSNASSGRTLHVPVWLRVLDTTPIADVLLVDDDGSSADASFPDYSQVYKDMLTQLGVSYEYLDVWDKGFKSLLQLYHYKAVLIFTGNNSSFDSSGFSPTDQDALSEWLDSGGRLWTTGQNFAEESDSNASFSSESLGRARIYHGYLGVMYVAGSAYGDEPAPRPTAHGKEVMRKLKLDLSPGSDGAGNQSSIEVMKAMPDTDTYAASDTMLQFFESERDDVHGGKTAIAFGRSSEPDLKDDGWRQQFKYRAVAMGFGLEGVNSTTGFSTRQQVAKATWDWLSDTITFGPLTTTPQKPGKNNQHVVFATTAASSAGAKIREYEWDFGDGDRFKTSNKPTIEHNYKNPGDYVVRVAATDELGHTMYMTQAVHIP